MNVGWYKQTEQKRVGPNNFLKHLYGMDIYSLTIHVQLVYIMLKRHTCVVNMHVLMYLVTTKATFACGRCGMHVKV